MVTIAARIYREFACGASDVGTGAGELRRLDEFSLNCSFESEDGTGITISEGAFISLDAVDELDRST